MDSTIDTGMILHYGLKTLGIFAIIFALAVLTPWMAKHVDNWIARYRASHEDSKNLQDKRLYSVRSIYELPPKKTESESEPKKSDKKKAVVSSRKKHD